MEKAAKTTQTATINEYIAGFPESTQLILEELRTTIRKQVPDAQESIKIMEFQLSH